MSTEIIKHIDACILREKSDSFLSSALSLRILDRDVFTKEEISQVIRNMVGNTELTVDKLNEIIGMWRNFASDEKINLCEENVYSVTNVELLQLLKDDIFEEIEQLDTWIMFNKENRELLPLTSTRNVKELEKLLDHPYYTEYYINSAIKQMMCSHLYDEDMVKLLLETKDKLGYVKKINLNITDTNFVISNMVKFLTAAYFDQIKIDYTFLNYNIHNYRLLKEYFSCPVIKFISDRETLDELLFKTLSDGKIDTSLLLMDNGANIRNIKMNKIGCVNVRELEKFYYGHKN